MRKPNAFEQAHGGDLKAAEQAALKTLKKLAENDEVADAVRVEAARIILSIRSDDA